MSETDWKRCEQMTLAGHRCKMRAKWWCRVGVNVSGHYCDRHAIDHTIPYRGREKGVLPK